MNADAVVTPAAYGTAIGLGAVACVVLCTGLPRLTPRGRRGTMGVLALILLADVASWLIAEVIDGTFSAKTSLPFALCDAMVLVAAVACCWPAQVLVELTYFIGLAGTLQGLVTPDLSVGFPHLVFFQYVVGHCGVIAAALALVIGERRYPSSIGVLRTFAIAACYTALVGIIDAAWGANYMFLRRPPSNWTLLRLLGPWPYYVLTAAVVAIVLFELLDLPFRRLRHHHDELETGPAEPDRDTTVKSRQ